MQLRPTPESRRVAIWTAVGAVAIAAVAAVLATGGFRFGWISWIGFAAAIATLLPALNALTARVDIDAHAVAVRWFGRTRRFDWSSIAGVHVIERRASVPDGTEYHWFTVQRAPHVVAVPCLDLSDGRMHELPMLASRAAGEAPRPADQNAEHLLRAPRSTQGASTTKT